MLYFRNKLLFSNTIGETFSLSKSSDFAVELYNSMYSLNYNAEKHVFYEIKKGSKAVGFIVKEKIAPASVVYVYIGERYRHCGVCTGLLSAVVEYADEINTMEEITFKFEDFTTPVLRVVKSLGYRQERNSLIFRKGSVM